MSAPGVIGVVVLALIVGFAAGYVIGSFMSAIAQEGVSDFEE